jgi:hypothetical protein
MVAFRCYDPSTDGSGGIHRWYGTEIGPEIRSAIDGALELMGQEVQLDGHPSFKALRGKCSGLAEIKIDIPVQPTSPIQKKKLKRRERIEINVRILGANEPPNTHFTLLVGFIKAGGPDYGPACLQAHRRHKGVRKNAGRARPCNFP